MPASCAGGDEAEEQRFGGRHVVPGDEDGAYHQAMITGAISVRAISAAARKGVAAEFSGLVVADHGLHEDAAIGDCRAPSATADTAVRPPR